MYRRWIKLLSAFFLLQTIEAFSVVDRLVYGEWSGKPGDKITQTNLLLIATSVTLFITGFRSMRSIRIGAIFAVGLIGFLLCSALWAVDPRGTIVRALLYLFVVVGAIGIVANLKGDEFVDLLALVCFLAGVASLILLVVPMRWGEGTKAIFVAFSLKGMYSARP